MTYIFTFFIFFFIHVKICFRTSIPQGEWKWLTDANKYPPGAFKLIYTFDFFNYAGIHRPVLLYSRPKNIHISDVTIVTKSVNVAEKSADVMYNIDIVSNSNNFNCVIQIENQLGEKVAEFTSCQETIMSMKNVNFWWPYMMDSRVSYQSE